MGDRNLALRDAAAAVIEFICLAKHDIDARHPDGYSVTTRNQLGAYCARGAEQNHEWVRVPATPLDEITTGMAVDRPPEPATRRDRLPQVG